MDNYSNDKIEIMKIRDKYLNSPKHGVSVIISTDKPKYFNNIMANYYRCCYPNIEFIILLNSNSFDIEKYKNYISALKNISIYQLDKDVSLGECLNFGIIHSNYDYIAKMDDDDYYGANYIGDLMNVFNYADVDFVGKAAHFIYFEQKNLLTLWNAECENTSTEEVAGATFLMKKYIFNSLKFNSLNYGYDIDFLVHCNNLGIKLYSGDKFNYIYNRHVDINDHSWKADDDLLINSSTPYCTTNDYTSFILV